MRFFRNSSPRAQRTSDYYGDATSGKFSDAAGIRNALWSVLDQMPGKFRRQAVIDELGLETPRELALLTDALKGLKDKGLLRWDESTNSWENLAR